MARFFPVAERRRVRREPDDSSLDGQMGTLGEVSPRSVVTHMAGPPTVLLVEDNDDNLRIYSTILTYSGYQVIEATDGEAGLAAARERRPDLILMDVSIPKIDGWEVTRMLKADPLTATIPVIALTAHALATDRERANEIGFDGYIAKPAEPRVVLAEVERRLGKAPAVRS